RARSGDSGHLRPRASSDFEGAAGVKEVTPHLVLVPARGYDGSIDLDSQESRWPVFRPLVPGVAGLEGDRPRVSLLYVDLEDLRPEGPDKEAAALVLGSVLPAQPPFDVNRELIAGASGPESTLKRVRPAGELPLGDGVPVRNVRDGVGRQT